MNQAKHQRQQCFKSRENQIVRARASKLAKMMACLTMRVGLLLYEQNCREGSLFRPVLFLVQPCFVPVAIFDIAGYDILDPRHIATGIYSASLHFIGNNVAVRFRLLNVLSTQLLKYFDQPALLCTEDPIDTELKLVEDFRFDSIGDTMPRLDLSSLLGCTLGLYPFRCDVLIDAFDFIVLDYIVVEKLVFFVVDVDSLGDSLWSLLVFDFHAGFFLAFKFFLILSFALLQYSIQLFLLFIFVSLFELVQGFNQALRTGLLCRFLLLSHIENLTVLGFDLLLAYHLNRVLLRDILNRSDFLLLLSLLEPPENNTRNPRSLRRMAIEQPDNAPITNFRLILQINSSHLVLVKIFLFEQVTLPDDLLGIVIKLEHYLIGICYFELYFSDDGMRSEFQFEFVRV